MVRNCVQSHLICNGFLTLLIITFFSLEEVFESMTACSSESGDGSAKID
jgi:hypothetical protein